MAPAPVESGNLTIAGDALKVNKARVTLTNFATVHVPSNDKRFNDLYNREKLGQLQAGTWMSNSIHRYRTLADKIGIDQNSFENIQNQVSNAVSASAIVEQHMIDLLDARYRLTNGILGKFGKSGFDAYIQLEEDYRVERELEPLIQYASENGAQLNEEDLTHIRKAISESGFVIPFRHGPLDPIPDPAIGRESVVSWLSSSKVNIQSVSESLVSYLSTRMPKDKVSNVETYYRSRLENVDSRINAIRSP